MLKKKIIFIFSFKNELNVLFDEIYYLSFISIKNMKSYFFKFPTFYHITKIFINKTNDFKKFIHIYVLCQEI